MHNLNIDMASIHEEKKVIQSNVRILNWYVTKFSTRTVHEKQKPNKCEICKKYFKKRGQDAFQVHLLWIYFLSKTAYERTCWKRSWREKPFLCFFLKKLNKIVTWLTDYISIFHEGRDPFKVQYLLQDFWKKNDCDIHVFLLQQGV